MAGVLVICWITVQVIVIVPDGGFSWLQPAMFAAGAIVAVLGWQLRGVHRRTVLPERNTCRE